MALNPPLTLGDWGSVDPLTPRLCRRGRNDKTWNRYSGWLMLRVVVVNRTTVTTAHGGTGDDVLDTDNLHHYQVYRGMSPNSSNRLEVQLSTIHRVK